MRAADGSGRGEDPGPIQVAVARDRRLIARRDQRGADLPMSGRVLWNVGPPRMRYEEAALDVALATSGEFDAIGAVARAVQGRHTTAVRMQGPGCSAAGTASRLPRAGAGRRGRGTCSVLEHGYLTRVERPHALPSGRRPLRVGTTSGVVYRDVALGEQADRARRSFLPRHGRAARPGLRARPRRRGRRRRHRPSHVGSGRRPAVHHGGEVSLVLERVGCREAGRAAGLRMAGHGGMTPARRSWSP